MCAQTALWSKKFYEGVINEALEDIEVVEETVKIPPKKKTNRRRMNLNIDLGETQ